ncbi:MAG: hypothetical protein ACJAU6_003656 [Alphaproteobacteria bacterium]|jgi:hypothetical protein
MTGNVSKSYAMYGHSAGAQFVHRFIYFTPDARLTRAVAANAGWYTMPGFDIAYPYGLGGAGLSPANLHRALSARLVVLLGMRDTDTSHRHLRRTEGANAQGPHRFARGQSFSPQGETRRRKTTPPSAGPSNTPPASAIKIEQWRNSQRRFWWGGIF